MLQSIRSHAQGWVAKAIIAFIICSFAIFGLEHLGGSLTGSSNVAASVGDINISKDQLANAVNSQRQMLMNQLGENFDPEIFNEQRLKDAALQQLISRAILRQVIKKANLQYSEKDLDNQIISAPQFQENGRYNPDRFKLWVRSMGMSPLQFRDFLRQNVMQVQMQAAYAGTDFVLPAELEKVSQIEHQTRDGAYIKLPIASLLEQVKVSDKQMQAYYKINKSNFMTENLVKLQYVVLDQKDLAKQIKVSDQELNTSYESLRQGLEDKARDHRVLEHILIKGGEKLSEQKANETYADLNDGANFATIARKQSSDPLTAVEGGYLGEFQPNIFSPEFDKVALSLAPGEISKPFKTPQGYEIIRRQPNEAAKIPALNQVKSKLEQQIREDKAAQDLVEKSRKLADIAYESSDLQDPAGQLNLSVKTSEYMSEDKPAKGILDNPKVVKAAFSDSVLTQGNNSDVIELSPQTMLVLRVKEHKKPKQQSFTEVKDQIKRILSQQMAEKKLADKASQAIEQLQQGKTPKALASDKWLPLKATSKSNRDLPIPILATLFELPRYGANKPSFGQAKLKDGSLALVELKSVTPGKDENKFTRDSLKTAIMTRQGELIYQQYLNAMESEYQVKINK